MSLKLLNKPWVIIQDRSEEERQEKSDFVSADLNSVVTGESRSLESELVGYSIFTARKFEKKSLVS
jgi:hypothetical protein